MPTHLILQFLTNKFSSYLNIQPYLWNNSAINWPKALHSGQVLCKTPITKQYIKSNRNVMVLLICVKGKAVHFIQLI